MPQSTIWNETVPLDDGTSALQNKKIKNKLAFLQSYRNTKGSLLFYLNVLLTKYFGQISL